MCEARLASCGTLTTGAFCSFAGLRGIASGEIVSKSLCRRFGFLGPDQTLDDLRKPAISALEESNTEACSDGHRISAWSISGRDETDLESYRTLLSSTGRLNSAKQKANLSYAGGTNYVDCSPWRFVIDHINRVILYTSTGSGLHCIDMERACSWMYWLDCELGSYLHIEADQGWIVLTTNLTDFRILRFRRLTPEGRPCRGELECLTRLEAIHRIRCFRLIFPHLLVGSSDGCATIYDITTGEILIDLHVQAEPNGLSRL